MQVVQLPVVPPVNASHGARVTPLSPILLLEVTGRLRLNASLSATGTDSDSQLQVELQVELEVEHRRASASDRASDCQWQT